MKGSAFARVAGHPDECHALSPAPPRPESAHQVLHRHTSSELSTGRTSAVASPVVAATIALPLLRRIVTALEHKPV